MVSCTYSYESVPSRSVKFIDRRLYKNTNIDVHFYNMHPIPHIKACLLFSNASRQRYNRQKLSQVVALTDRGHVFQGVTLRSSRLVMVYLPSDWPEIL
jgi:hypothetical protein